ncbi:hypothetical protein FEM48_Zijuj05G0021100 [Ziziphus jujuba var. spinosa]|uniref:Uncharacterized protein n=1 Tax=Ziziphus jujuba var. spinosa TaxID=714518 RepID=A0A978VC68_ZIZJJ|nr:hypothetical protein FEM48_Zijuj05G0021100 [Ziziphus jujuba var. spinosa]
MNIMWPAGKDQLVSNNEKHSASLGATNSYILRFLNLKPQETDVANGRLPAHKDLSFATIVHQIDVGGLQPASETLTGRENLQFYAGLKNLRGSALAHKYVLPKHKVRIANVYRAVEVAKSKFTVSAWGLTDTTVEDVFIKVAKGTQSFDS